jgi:hypothetical protein
MRIGLELGHPIPGGPASNGYGFGKRAQSSKRTILWNPLQCRQVEHESNFSPSFGICFPRSGRIRAKHSIRHA